MEAPSLAVYGLPEISRHSHHNRPHVLIDLEPPNDTDPLVHEQLIDPAILQTSIPAPTPTSSQPLVESNSQFWKVFGSTFITIFLAELGDKTQVATLLMSAEAHDPWSVFTGAAIALIATSLLGVLVGQWLCSRFSPRMLDVAAGITLALLSIGMLWEAVCL